MGNKYKLKKSKLTDEKSLEKISKHLLEAAESPNPEASDDDAPEEVGFGASKDKALGEIKQIKGTIKEIKATKKLKRKQLQERNRKQKKDKVKDLDKLPDSIIQNLPSWDEPDEEKAESPDLPEADLLEAEELKAEKISDKNSSEPEIEADGSFIPLKRKKKSKCNIKVVSLEKKNPNPTLPAVNFREQMLYGGNISRHSAVKLFKDLKKRRT